MMFIPFIFLFVFEEWKTIRREHSMFATWLNTVKMVQFQLTDVYLGEKKGKTFNHLKLHRMTHFHLHLFLFLFVSYFSAEAPESLSIVLFKHSYKLSRVCAIWMCQQSIIMLLRAWELSTVWTLLDGKLD